MEIAKGLYGHLDRKMATAQRDCWQIKVRKGNFFEFFEDRLRRNRGIFLLHSKLAYSGIKKRERERESLEGCEEGGTEGKFFCEQSSGRRETENGGDFSRWPVRPVLVAGHPVGGPVLQWLKSCYARARGASRFHGRASSRTPPFTSKSARSNHVQREKGKRKAKTKIRTRLIRGGEKKKKSSLFLQSSLSFDFCVSNLLESSISGLCQRYCK